MVSRLRNKPSEDKNFDKDYTLWIKIIFENPAGIT